MMHLCVRRALSPYYFRVGARVAKLTEDDELRKKLRAALSGERFEKIYDWSQNSGPETDVNELLDKLTEEERSIFYAGYHAAKAQRAQRSNRSGRIATSSVFAKSARDAARASTAAS